MSPSGSSRPWSFYLGWGIFLEHSSIWLNIFVVPLLSAQISGTAQHPSVPVLPSTFRWWLGFKARENADDTLTFLDDELAWQSWGSWKWLALVHLLCISWLRISGTPLLGRFPEITSFDKRSHPSSKEIMEGRNKVFRRKETVSADSRPPVHFFITVCLIFIIPPCIAKYLEDPSAHCSLADGLIKPLTLGRFLLSRITGVY